MFTASQFLPAAGRFCRQIVPPVVATLIAAGLISTYNKSFSGHLSQPRLGGLNDVNAADGTAAPITTVGMTKPPAAPTAPVSETITIYEEAIAPERLTEKDASEESGKDQTIKIAAEPAPTPRAASAAPRAEPPHRVAAVEIAQPVVRAPAPVIVAVPPAVVAPPASAPVVAAMPQVQEQRPHYQQPYQPYQPYPPQVQQYPQPQYQSTPPVIVATPPMVTVPDRPTARPAEEAQVQPPAPPQGAFGTFVNALKPSTWFARAREFGQKIEDTGNEILPSIRQ